MRRFVAIVAIAIAVCGSSCRCNKRSSVAPAEGTLNGRPVVLDAAGKILPRAPYDRVVRAAFLRLASFPIEKNGLPTWWSYSRFAPPELHGVDWPHNPAGLNAMLVDSALGWYAFSGDASVIALVRASVDHHLAHGLTPEGGSWARVPFASATPGATDYAGADDAWCDNCGRGDGVGVIEPDKVGELGYALLRLYEATGEARYRDAAIDCATALAKHVIPGDDQHSPWPFRVRASDDVAREAYTAHALGPVMLFDEAIRLGLGDVASFGKAREMAWSWMMRVPMKSGAWTQYFEDITIQDAPTDNPNQYAPMQLAKYLLDHPEHDPDWRAHVEALIAWTTDNFAGDTNDERGNQYGAEVLSEQRMDMAKMSSHTARFGAVLARFHELTGDARAKERAFRALNWATYWCDDDGVVKVGPNDGEGWWFTDGYGDYIRHFVQAMGAVPEWAPKNQDHLLRSTSVVKWISYAPDAIRFRTFDGKARDLLKLHAAPKSIAIDGAAIAKVDGEPGAGDGWSMRVIDGGVVVTLKREAAGDVVVSL